MIKLSLGGVVPADARLTAGNVLLDQSMLTGKSVPIEAVPGLQKLCRCHGTPWGGEAEVTATGVRTKFGRTAELVRTAHVVSSQQKAVVRVVRNLVGFAGCVIVMLAVYAFVVHLPTSAIVPLVLTAVLGSIPVACLQPSPSRLRSARRRWRNSGCCRRGSRRSMKPARWTCCAWTRPARSQKTR